jgi:hypothetical protein
VLAEMKNTETQKYSKRKFVTRQFTEVADTTFRLFVVSELATSEGKYKTF